MAVEGQPVSANITRAELCRRAVEKLKEGGDIVSERFVGDVVDAFLAALSGALAAGGRVELRGLGSFRPAKWAARRVKPPKGPLQRAKQAGVRAVKSAFSVRFRPGAALRRIR